MKVNGKDDMPYMKWKIKHVPNHQPVVVFYTEKWPAFCGAYPWLTRLPFTAETPERLPAQRRAWTKHRPPQHPAASWNPGEVGDGMNWLTSCTLMMKTNEIRQSQQKSPSMHFMHSLQTIWSFATPIPALILQEVEEILRQQSVHGINIFGEMAQDPASRYGVKEVQGCRHDPLQQLMMDAPWGCDGDADHQPCTGKGTAGCQGKPKAKTSEVVGRFFLCVDSIPSSPQSHEAIRVDPHGFNGQHAE